MQHEFGITMLGEGKDAFVLRMCEVCGLTHILDRESSFWREVTEPLEKAACTQDDDLEIKGEHLGFSTRR